MSKLEGKVAIITGAGQGIGRGIALAFAKEGAKVAIAETNPETGPAVAEEIRNLGRQALAVACDVGDEEDVKKMVKRVVAEFGVVDILVNNAQRRAFNFGISSAPLEEFPEDVWDLVFQTGVKASFYCSKAVFPHMKNRGGKIINFGSRNGIEGTAGTVAYNANKEAIRALTRTAAREWGKYKINVNVICPAAETPTVVTFRARFPELYKENMKASPLGRMGDPERDLGRAAVFLASQDSDFITGQTIMVDGGMFMFP